MSHRANFVALSIAVGLASACAELDKLRGDSTPTSSGGTLYTLEWGTKAGVERKSVEAPIEIAEPDGGDSKLTRVTTLDDNTWLLGFDVKPGNDDAAPEILMSILEKLELNRGKLCANIWTANLESTTNKKRLTEGDWLDFSPTYIPGENAILFSSNRYDGSFSICKKRLGGGGLVRVTSEAAMNIDPQVHPDEKRKEMLFTQIREASAQQGVLWRRTIELGSPEQVGEGRDARWSLDGKSILYSAYNSGSGKFHIWKRSIDGGGAAEEITPGNQNDIQPCWSLEGQRIVFASDRGVTSTGKPNYDIWMMNVDGKSNLQQLTFSDAWDDNPRWLDSDTIVFRSNRGGKWDVWSLKLSNSGQ